MRLPIPLPLCDRHFQEVAAIVTHCPECRARVIALLDMPIVSRFLPPEMRDTVAKVITLKKLEGAENAEHP